MTTKIKLQRNACYAPAFLTEGTQSAPMSWRQITSPRHEELRKILIERRIKAGLKQSELGELVGRTQGFVSRIENGSHRVTAVELTELSEALNFDAAAVIRRMLRKPAK